jgi:hypothetical protein
MDHALRPAPCRRRVAFGGVAKGLVGGDEEPAVATLLQKRAAGHRGKAVSVETPLDAVR